MTVKARLALLGAVLVGVGLAVLLRAADVAASPAYVIGLVVTVAVVGLLLASVHAVVEPVPQVGVEEVPQPMPYRELVSLEERMSWGAVDRHRFDERVRPQLLRVAGERLRQRHGVRLLDEPDRARSIMGDELWAFLTAPPNPAGQPVGRRELDRVVRQMEAL
jgi:hypothetical protein